MLDWRTARLDPGLNFAVLGAHVENSLSPAIHSAALASAGLEGSYRAFSVRAEKISECLLRLSELGYRGVNITHPHKAAAAHLANMQSDVVQALGVSNTLTFGDAMRADNTDVEGFFAPISNMPPGSALVLGCGGAGIAAIYALITHGWQVHVWNRTHSNAEATAQRLHDLGSIRVVDNPSVDNCSLLVNATSGVASRTIVQEAVAALQSSATFFDMNYLDGPIEIPESLRFVDGREMLVEQAALAFEIWTGVRADRDAMRAAAGLD